MGILTYVVNFFSRCFAETSLDTYSIVKTEILRRSFFEDARNSSAADGEANNAVNDINEESEESCDESDTLESPYNETNRRPAAIRNFLNRQLSRFGRWRSMPELSQVVECQQNNLVAIVRRTNRTRRNEERINVANENGEETNTPLRVYRHIQFVHPPIVEKCRRYLVPKQREIARCPYYWGKMDRYEADQVLEHAAEGTFLLRDSAQKRYMYSVSFRKYDRILHARIETCRHRYSFDIHDQGVKSCSSVLELIEHYRNPEHIMFFEPTLTQPINRNFVLSLQQLCRATICDYVRKYDNIDKLDLPEKLIDYLKEFHYCVTVPTKRNRVIFFNRLEELAQMGY